MLSAIVQTLVTTAMRQSNNMLISAMLPVQVEKAQFELCSQLPLDGRSYLVLASGISTITLGGLALVASESAQGRTSACTSNMVPASSKVEYGTCMDRRVNEATQDTAQPNVPSCQVHFSAMNLQCKTCNRPSFSIRGVSADMMNSLQYTTRP